MTRQRLLVSDNEESDNLKGSTGRYKDIETLHLQMVLERDGLQIEDTSKRRKSSVKEQKYWQRGQKEKS